MQLQTLLLQLQDLCPDIPLRYNIQSQQNDSYYQQGKMLSALYTLLIPYQ